MKLTIKIYSPFLLFLLITIYSCNKKNSDIAVLVPSELSQGQIFQDKAESFSAGGNYDSAYYYYHEAQSSFKELENDSVRVAYPLLKMAGIQKIMGDYAGSESAATEALSYLKYNDSLNYKGEVYNVLGMNYRETYNYDSSIKYFEKGYTFAKDSLDRCMILYNASITYIEKGDYKKALSLLDKLNSFQIVTNNPIFKASLFKNYGTIYLKQKSPQALSFINEAYEIRMRIGDKSKIISSCLQLADYYKKKDVVLAKQYVNQALDIANQIKNPEEKLEALKLKVDLYEGDDVKKYSLEYISLSDSITRIKQIAKNQFAMIKYDSKYNLERLEKEKIESEKKTFRIRIIIGISLLIIIILILISRINKLKHKKEKIQEVYVTETRISKKIHDELANDVFNTMNFVENQDFSNPEQHQKLIHSLDHIYNKTRDISRENNNIDTGENFDKTLKEMLSDYNTPQVSIIIINYDAINWKSVTDHKKIALYRVLQEIMVNMKKHSNASSVVIRFDIVGKNIIIQYTDNGVGIDKNHINYKNGLQNAENRILTILGNISFGTVNDKGLKITITIPS